MPGATKQRNVRVSEATYQALRELAAESGEPLTVIVGRAVERHRRERLLARANVAWTALQADPAAMADIEAEQRLWDQTLTDGLAGDEW